jgi:outer membrane beta-barrel protein
MIFTSEKDILKDLKSEFGRQFKEHREPKYMVHSHLVFKPFYGKSAIWNRGIVNHETYFFLGGGIVNYEWIYPEDDPRSLSTDTENATSISFGVGQKYFLSQNWCINFEIRDMVNMFEDKNENRLYFGIGIGWRFNLLARKADKNEDLERLNEYLKKE